MKEKRNDLNINLLFILRHCSVFLVLVKCCDICEAFAIIAGGFPEHHIESEVI